MNTKSPMFSIVIPTRNRVHLLRYALQSALDQRFDDYEVVVSDNYSSDDTFKVVEELANKRVRYVRTDNSLSMPDSWEFALSQARGEYVTFLCDDDAVSPKLLQRIAIIIVQPRPLLINWACASYYHNNWYEPERRNQLVIPHFSGQIYEFDSRCKIKDLFDFRIGRKVPFYTIPLTLNSFCHRDIIARVKAGMSRFFLAPCPDYASSLAMLSEVKSYTYIDDFLMIGGGSEDSIGLSSVYKRGETFQRFLEEFQQVRILRRVPLKMQCGTNLIAETLLTMKNKMPDKLSNFDLNWKEYVFSIYQELLSYQDHGVNVSKEMQEFYHMLRQQPAKLRLALRYLFLKRMIRKIINKVPILRHIEVYCRPSKRVYQPVAVVRGEDVGFSNILECVRQLDRLIAKNRS